MSEHAGATRPDPFTEEIVGRLGVMPNLFRANGYSGPVQALWVFTKAAYLDSPLPPLLKERLVVHLARYTSARYCIVRHTGFLLGYGRPAGDFHVRPDTVEGVMSLLRRPSPDVLGLDAVFSRLGAARAPLRLSLLPRGQEADLFDALSSIFLAQPCSPRARQVLRHAVGGSAFEHLIACLTWVKAVHQWVETHPEIEYEPDVIALMSREPVLARLLLDPSKAGHVPPEPASTNRTWSVEAVDLSDRESHMAAIVAQASVGLSRISPNARILMVNDELCRILGRSREELLAIGVAEVTLPDDIPMCSKALKEVWRTGQSVTLDKRYLRPNGEVVHARSCLTRLEENGRPEGILAVTIDLTERVHMEQTLRAREAELARVQRIGGIGGFDIDIAGGLKGHRSPEYQCLHGLHPFADNETYASWLDRVHPDDRAHADATFRESLANTDSYESEYRIIRPSDGGIRWIAAKADIERDAQGRPIRLVGVHIDITSLKLAEQTRRESEERFRALAEATSVAIFRMSPDWRQLRELINKGFVADTSASSQDWMHGYIPAEEHERMRRAIDAAIAGKSPFELEHRVIRANGSIGWTLSRAVPLLDANGAIREWFGAASDISGRRAAESALRESEVRFRALVQSNAQAMWETDAAGIVVADSPSWRAYTGQRLGEWLGKGWLNAIHPEDRAYAERIWREAVATGADAESEFRLWREGEGWRWTNVRAVPIVDDDGKVRKWVGMNIDIHARKEAEAALRLSEERLRQFGEASSDILWVRDAHTLQWEYLSPAFEHIYGIAREEALAGDNFGNWIDLMLPQDRDLVRMNIERVRAGETATFEYRIRRPTDGMVRWLRNSDFPIMDHRGTVVRIGGICHDTTDEKAVAERMKVMVAELQHRTRNLIAVVRSIAEQTMAETGPTEAFLEQFGDRLAALARVQGLLSRSDQEPTNIRSLIQMELDALGAPSDDDRIALEGDEVPIRHSVVQTLALALHELATNARKYGALSVSGGRLWITWQVAEGDALGRRLRLQWRETGSSTATATEAVRRFGYGRELIEQALPYALGATTHYTIDGDGVHCSIDMPLERRATQRD